MATPDTAIIATADYAEDVANSTIVRVSIAGTVLLLHTKGGAQISVGNVVPIMESYEMYPVSSVYTTTTSAAPEELLFGGSWTLLYTEGVSIPIDGVTTLVTMRHWIRTA